MKHRLRNIRNAVAYNQKIYFVPSYYCSLYELDVNNGYKVKRICDFPWISYQGPVECILDGNKVWCIAVNSLQISSYNMDDKKIEHFRYPDMQERENIALIKNNDIIWILPRNIPDYIVGFSITQKHFLLNDQIIKFCANNQIKGKIISSSKDKNSVAMLLQHSGSVLRFCPDTLSLEMKIVPSDATFFGIAHDENMFYLSMEHQRKLLLWNDQSNEIKIYEDMTCHDGHYIKLLKVKCGLLLMDGTRVQTFDGKKIKDYKVEGLSNLSGQGSHFVEVNEYGENYLFMPWNANMILETDKNLQNVFTQELVCSHEDWVRKVKYFMEQDIPLKDYVQVMIDNDYVDADRQGKQDYGLKIYDYLKKM